MRLVLCALGIIVAVYANAEELTLPDETISNEAMDAARGGQDVHMELDIIYAESDIYGYSSGNVANNTVSGNNILSSGAFADSSGLSNIIQNTGNNVLIQNSTIVNLTLK